MGPVYIRQRCSSCHADDARGPGIVLKMSIVDDDGYTMAPDQSLLPFGHTVRPAHTSAATMGTDRPDAIPGLLVTRRFAPAVFGRGYIDAVLDSEIERVEMEQAMRTDGVSGHINRVTFTSEANPDTRFHQHAHGASNLIGRFGLKARIPTVDDFVADAYQGDMGITSPMRPSELVNAAGVTEDAVPGIDIDIDTVNAVADYVRMLEIPVRRTLNAQGQAAFAQAQCTSCHVPTMHTRANYPIALLADIDAPIYTDLLVHDMGATLADGLDEGSSTSREWRTAPLMGMRTQRNYLHDGRVSTIRAAIEAHGDVESEGNASLNAFHTLSAEDQEALIEFVSQL
ncbi:MAG: c-type cytochrome [Sandaracinaceae bacterium]|nr:c-type cytochrome [Sandaracinaceae bacterium]